MERDTSLDHRSIEWAVDIIGMCEQIRCHQGGMWFGRNHNLADATFVDYGAADAFAVAAKALPTLVKALQEARSALATLDHMNGVDSGLDVIRGGKPIKDIIDAALNGVVGGPSHD